MKIDLFQSIKPYQWFVMFCIFLLVSVLGYQIFWPLTFGNYISDIPSHCQFAATADSDCHFYPANFGLYLAVNFLRHRLPDVEYLHGQYYAMLIILSISLAVKWMITTLILRQMLIIKTKNVHFAISVLFGVAMLFMFAIPYRYLRGESFYYLGSFVPNVWHNSTIIASIPFSLLIFWLSAKELERPVPRRIIWISILVFFQVCVKPSYVFVYLAGFPLLFFLRYKLHPRYLIHYIPAALSILLIVIQWWLIFKINTSSWDNGHVIFTVFGYWKSISTISMLPLALSASVAAPLMALFAIEKEKNWYGIYATTIFIFAVIIYLTVAEEGPRFNSGNFFWQIVPATYILFMVALPSLYAGLMSFTSANLLKKVIIVVTAILFLAHFASGLYYFKYIYTTGFYI